jgi:small redox-active disulfide protein 2
MVISKLTVSTLNIKILGSGCINCQTLYKRTEEALKDLNIKAVLEKETDYQKIASYGIMRTPGLVIDGKVAISGFVPSVEKIKEILLAQTSA